MKRTRYKCSNCGNDSRFRALAKFNDCEVIVDGSGELLDPCFDSQVNDPEDVEILEVRDCLECGSTKVSKEEGSE
jgi:DNA-directed RNA polymerase subunit RPC12/RpoP